jgi:hypothetical protein
MPRAQKTGSWGHCRSGDFPDREEKQAQEASVAGHQWLTPVILATQEAEIKRIAIWSQPGQIICDTLSRKNSIQKRAGGAAKGICPEFKPQYCKKKKKPRYLVRWSWGCFQPILSSSPTYLHHLLYSVWPLVSNSYVCHVPITALVSTALFASHLTCIGQSLCLVL